MVVVGEVVSLPLFVVGGYSVREDVLVEEEYFLLYYREWVWEESVGEAFPELKYCVRIPGLLSSVTALALAAKFRLNYYIAERGKKYSGFTPYDTGGEEPDGGFYRPFYEIATRQSISDWLWVDCGTAIIHYNEKVASGECDEAIKSMQDVLQFVEILENPSPAKPTLDFKGLTADKGQWIPVGEFAALTKVTVDSLEYRRTAEGSVRSKDKMRGVDSAGRHWKKMGRPLKSGKKSTKKKICYYWVTHEEYRAGVAKTTESVAPGDTNLDGCAAVSK